jgi:hypothetical protein
MEYKNKNQGIVKNLCKQCGGEAIYSAKQTKISLRSLWA